jgi:hypothetical protein
MTLTDELQPWLFPVEPLEGESFSHFLSRFRRRNHLTPSALGQLAGIGRWQRFHLNPFPSAKETVASNLELSTSGLRPSATGGLLACFPRRGIHSST